MTMELNCVVCETPINPTDYEQNGNYCEKCCVKATQIAHKRVRERREMDELRGVDKLGTLLKSMV